MKDSLMRLALSDNRANHILFLELFKLNEFTVKDIILSLVRIFRHDIKNGDLLEKDSCDHSYLCSYRILGNMHCDFNQQEDDRVKGYRVHFYHGLLNDKSEIVSFLKHHDYYYMSEGLIKYWESFLDSKLQPIKHFTINRTSELIFWIKRKDKKVIKFFISYNNTARLNRLLLKSNYLSIFFFYKPEFLYYLYDYFVTVGMFDECTKIDETINRINLYFKPSKKINLIIKNV